MNTVFADFHTRAQEVEGYFRFVLRLSAEELSLRKAQGDEAAYSNQEHEELLKTLKAACYLLLYNLVESTMRNAIEAIFDELRTEGISFDECREELRREILLSFRRRNMERLLPRLISIARDIIYESFERSETFAANLDARMIRRTAKRFGFPAPTGNEFQLLQTVKDVRNDLAHGVKSFAEVGRNASPTDLDNARVQTVDILTQTLGNIRNYLQNKHYLTVAPAPAA